MSIWKKHRLWDMGTLFHWLSWKKWDDFGSGKEYLTYKTIFANGILKDYNPKNYGLVNIAPWEKQNQIQFWDIFFTVSSETSHELGMSSVFLIKNQKDIFLNSFCFWFRLWEPLNISLHLLWYILRSHSFRKQLTTLAQWSTRYNLSRRVLLNTSINLPEDITEQEKIAEILAKIDTAIQLTESSISKQERVKKWLMQDLITNGIDANGNIRSEETHKFKDSELGRIPEEWDIFETWKGLYMKGRIWWQWLKANEFMKDGDYLVTGTDFTKDNKVNWSTCYRISHERYEQAPEIQLKIWDVLLTKDGTIWKVALIDYLPWRASLNSHLLVLRPFSNISIKPEFLFYSLLTEEFKIFIEKIKTGSTITGLSQANFWKYLIKLPPPIEQEKIASVIQKQESVINETKDELLKLQRIKIGLMQDLLTGKVRVDNLLLQ